MDSSSAAAAYLSHRPTLESWARIRTSPFWIGTIAFFLRVCWIVLGHTYRFKSTDDNFGFGWEMGRIGAALATGHGFSNPFGPATGPTAWEPPLYPYLTAGVFLIFGTYSKPARGEWPETGLPDTNGIWGYLGISGPGLLSLCGLVAASSPVACHQTGFISRRVPAKKD